jgi:hypothetical protein
MAREFSLRSPGFYEREVDLTQRVVAPIGVPAGVIGTAQMGSAFVPVTLGSMADFNTKFGNLDPKMYGPYLVSKYIENRTAITYLRVLGAGANDSIADIEKTRTTGQVRSAGFVVTGSAATQGSYHVGAVQFILASHDVRSDELSGLPMFSDNDSYGVGLVSGSDVRLVRAVVFTANNTRLHVLGGDDQVAGGRLEQFDDAAALGTGSATFKLIISSSDPTFDQADGFRGLRILSASLDPDNVNYVGKVLNTDPDKFGEQKHLLYLDFAVDDTLARVVHGPDSVVIASGSAATSRTSGDTAMSFRDAFGHFDTRFRAARTPWIVSQPYGSLEHDLFYFESLHDGVYSNRRHKVTITNVRKSVDPSSDYGTFTVQVRMWDDMDQDPEVVEQFTNVTLDPTAENYIGAAIGDKKVYYNFDAETDDDKRLIVDGQFPNRSNFVRIVVSSALTRGAIPTSALPFGFRGVPTLKTNDGGTDETSGMGTARLAFSGSAVVAPLSGAIVPPLPFRFKVTRGTIDGSDFAGSPGVTEVVDGRLCWGVKFERTTSALNANVEKEKNKLVEAYTKMQGISKLDAVTTGSMSDDLNENKFTLARVALFNQTLSDVLTGTVNSHMLEAAYIRNGSPDTTSYRVSDGVITNRITLGTLVALTSSVEFNRFSEFAKFTMLMYGGFDGVNIIDKDASRLNDRAASTDTDGGANSAFTPSGSSYNPAGIDRLNNAVNSYRVATRIMTDPMTTNINLLAIPGIRDTYITDNAASLARDSGMMMYIMDLVKYDDAGNRLYDNSTSKPDVQKTAEKLDARTIDNNSVATYFPDVVMHDAVNNRNVTVPASVAALAALGLNDRVAYPWFAPAGFNRASLEWVKALDVNADNDDRDILCDARINPIAKFPREGIVIWGQKTLQYARSALDRVNVKRLLIEVKRVIVDVAQRIVFEQNTTETRQRFVSQTNTLLAVVQAQVGIQGFKVIMDDTNNSLADVEANKLRGRIMIIPVRTVEFIPIDFIVTPSGVEFVE